MGLPSKATPTATPLPLLGTPTPVFMVSPNPLNLATLIPVSAAASVPSQLIAAAVANGPSLPIPPALTMLATQPLPRPMLAGISTTLQVRSPPHVSENSAGSNKMVADTPEKIVASLMSSTKQCKRVKNSNNKRTLVNTGLVSDSVAPADTCFMVL